MAGSLAIAAPARALVVPGDVAAVPGACVLDVGGSAPVPAGCTTAPGLGGATALAADGPQLFVAGPDDDAVVALGRQSATGAALPGLPPRADGCVAASTGRCNHIVAGLRGADAFAVSPDGRDLYVGTRDDRAVVGFTAATLAPIDRGCVSGAPHHRCRVARVLRSISGLAMTNDGRFLYAAGYGSSPGTDTIVTLRRNPATGSLVVAPGIPCVQSDGPAALCARRAAGLEGVTSVIVSPDGRFAYAAAPISGAVVAFVRNRVTGSLTPIGGAGGCLHDPSVRNAGNAACAGVAPGLRGATRLVMAPGAATLYALSGDPGSVVALHRDPATGALAPTGPCVSAQTLTGCTTDAALRGAAGGLIAGGQLLVAASAADTIASLAIAPATGALSPADGATHATGSLDAPVALAQSGGGRQLYVASALDDAVETLSLDAGAS